MATTQSAEAPAGPDAAKVATISAAAMGALMTLGALGLFSGRAALSVAAGAIIAVANLVALSAIIRAVLRAPAPEAGALEPDAKLALDDAGAEAKEAASEEPEGPAIDHAGEGKRAGAAWGAFALVKMVVLFGGIYVLLTRGLVDPISLAVGYGVLPLGITVSGLFTSLAPRPSSRVARRRRTPTE